MTDTPTRAAAATATIARGSSRRMESSMADAGTTSRILLASGIDAMLDPIHSRGHEVIVEDISRSSTARLHMFVSSVDIVLLNVTASSRDIMAMIRDLMAVIGACDVAPRVLCFSAAHRNSDFVRAIQKYGAGYVRVSDSAMLLEAIDLLLADMDELRRNGPCFHMLHRFSHGACGPGEEAAAVLYPCAGELFQLPLALSGRLVFNFLAEHPRIAFDSKQIASGLRGGWFYRDHAANSGVRQLVKVRVPAVKVIIQRSREAMSVAFEHAHVRIDPFDVLQSLPAAGSGNRILYKLKAEVIFRHSID
jgi:hypothetical protein